MFKVDFSSLLVTNTDVNKNPVEDNNPICWLEDMLSGTFPLEAPFF